MSATVQNALDVVNAAYVVRLTHLQLYMPTMRSDAHVHIIYTYEYRLNMQLIWLLRTSYLVMYMYNTDLQNVEYPTGCCARYHVDKWRQNKCGVRT